MTTPTLLSTAARQDGLEAQKAPLRGADGDVDGDFGFTEVSASEVVRRSQLQCAAAAAIAALSVGGVVYLRGVLDVGACAALGYVFGVFCFQNNFMEYPHLPPHILLLLSSALLAMMAPTALASYALWDHLAVRCVAWAVDAAIVVAGYRCMVRGPCYQDLGNLEGKTYVITGCNTGIGYETARALACAGAKVVFACRSEDKARAAMDKIVEEADGEVDEDQLVFLPLDVSSCASVRKFAELFRETGLSVEALILNAGVMLSNRGLSPDGLEMTMASNHFGHFLLVQLLLPSFLEAEAKGQRPRIVVVGSNMQYLHDGFDFSEVAKVEAEDGRAAFMEKPYELFRAYGQSKLANLYFVRELARRLREQKSMIPVNVIHPGEVLTEVMRDMHPVIVKLNAIFRPVALGFMKSPTQGSFCTLHVATAPELATSEGASGLHFVRLQPAPLSAAGRDKDAAQRLWAISERVTAAAGPQV